MSTHPDYYNQGRIEVLDFIRDQRLDFELGNVVKYVCRQNMKGGVEDLRKALDYLEKYIEAKKVPEPEWVEVDLNDCHFGTGVLGNTLYRNKTHEGVVTPPIPDKYRISRIDGYVKVSELEEYIKKYPVVSSVQVMMYAKEKQRPILTVWEKRSE